MVELFKAVEMIFCNNLFTRLLWEEALVGLMARALALYAFRSGFDPFVSLKFWFWSSIVKKAKIMVMTTWFAKVHITNEKPFSRNRPTTGFCAMALLYLFKLKRNTI